MDKPKTMNTPTEYGLPNPNKWTMKGFPETRKQKVVIETTKETDDINEIVSHIVNFHPSLASRHLKYHHTILPDCVTCALEHQAILDRGGG